MSSTPESLVYHFSEEAEFKRSAESSHRPRIQFNSPLFNLVTRLQAESSPLVATIQSIREHTAFLINVSPSSVHIPLFPATQYVLTSRHFRIDQYCKTSERSQHGLSPIHYTETYEFIDPESGEKEYIVVHGYLTAHGKYLYSEIKNYQDAERTVLSDTQFTVKEVQELEQSLITNINTSRTLLDGLLQEKKKRIIDFKTQADKHEQELVTLSRTLYSYKSLAQYITVAHLLIEEITQLNQYSDILDARANIMYKRLPILTARIELLKTFTLPKATTVQEKGDQPKVCDDTESVQNPTESTLETLAKKTIHTLESQQKQLEEFFNENKNLYAPLSPNFNKICEILQIITDIEEHLLLALCLPNDLPAPHKEKVDMLFKKTQATIDEHYTQCLTVLDFGRRTANLLTIQALFPLLETKIPKTFFEQLIDFLINSNESEMTGRRKKLITICDYLHLNSELYNKTLLEMSEQKTYKILAKRIPNFLPRTGSPNETIDTYPLFTTYINNNVDIFDMLLRHGVNPNCATYQSAHKNNKLKLASTFYCIVLNNTEDYINYIQILLKYNANPNLYYSKEQVAHAHKESLQQGISDIKSITKIPKAQRSTIICMPKNLGPTGLLSPLVLIADRNDSEGIDLVLPYMDINNLALLLAMITTEEDIFHMGVKRTIQPSIRIFPDEQEADRNFSCESTPPSSPFLTYFIYPKSDSKKTKTIKNWYNYFQNAYRFLVEKIHSSTTTSDYFEKSYQRLLKDAIIENTQKNHENAYNNFIACEFLFTERYKTLSNIQEKHQLLQRCIPKLSHEMLSIIPKIFSDPNLRAFNAELQTLYSVRLQVCEEGNNNTKQPSLTFSDKPVVTGDVAPPVIKEKKKKKKGALGPPNYRHCSD